MNKQIPAFLLAENPADENDLEQFIYSSKKGSRALIDIEPVNITALFEMLKEKHVQAVFFVSKASGLPEFYILSISDNIDVQEDDIDSVLNEAAKWYKHFLITEDRLSFSGKPVRPLLNDYNYKVKGLKVLVSRNENTWLFIFRGRVRVFNSETEGFKWISEKFNVKPFDLQRGHCDIVEDVEDMIEEVLDKLV